MSVNKWLQRAYMNSRGDLALAMRFLRSSRSLNAPKALSIIGVHSPGLYSRFKVEPNGSVKFYE